MVVAPIITVFGATGFLGQRIVRHLYDRGCAVRIASRHPARGRALFGADDPRLQPVEGDLRSSQSVAAAIAGAHAVVNSAGLYTEHGKETFHSVHVEGAPSALLWKRAGLGLSSSCTSLGSVLTLNRDHRIFAAAARANWPSGQHIRVQS